VNRGTRPPVPPAAPATLDLRAITSHHSDHRNLLTVITQAPRSRKPVHAIIVPSARPAPHLDHAIALSQTLDCVLLVLCSKAASAGAVVARARRGMPVVAVDVGGLGPLLPKFRTSRPPANDVFRPASDLSFKRNLGLLIAKMAGWERVVFLDDDIQVPEPTDLRSAANLTDDFESVGLFNKGFPDNSVVCHAYRQTGRRQGTFVGGGAMAVAAQRTFSLFPEVYNEDWFFLVDCVQFRPTAAYGSVWQQDYDPFADPVRARGEEFGDCLAEGIYALLDSGRRVQDADERFWAAFLEDRRRLIAEIVANLERRPFDFHVKRRMLASMVAAERRRALIRPSDCVEFLSAWKVDRRAWRSRLGDSAATSLGGALRRVGVPKERIHRPPRTVGALAAAFERAAERKPANVAARAIA
jgi:hypothetical protein